MLIVIVFNMRKLLLLRTFSPVLSLYPPEVRTVFTVCNPHQQSAARNGEINAMFWLQLNVKAAYQDKA